MNVFVYVLECLVVSAMCNTQWENDDTVTRGFAVGRLIAYEKENELRKGMLNLVFLSPGAILSRDVGQHKQRRFSIRRRNESALGIADALTSSHAFADPWRE